MRPLGWGLFQHEWGPDKKRRFRHKERQEGYTHSGKAT